MCENCKSTVADSNVFQEVPAQTIGQVYDARIKSIKEHLETVTIAKAKAETLGFLNFPAKDLQAVLGWVI